MKALFSKQQAEQVIADYKYLVGTLDYIHPYPTLKVGFIRAEINSDGTYDINVGVSANQLEIPEFMGFNEHFRPLLIFLKLKGITFDVSKYRL